MRLGHLIMLVALLSSHEIFSQVNYGYHKVNIESSTITINGKTNINQFECFTDQSSLNDSILVKNIWSNLKIEFEGLILKYRIDDFSCGIQAMTKEFRELMKAESEPFLFLHLNSITICQDNNAFEELDVDADVKILLGGEERLIQIEGGKVINHSSARMTLKGEKRLLMSDFNIEPPTKFLGLVKANDEIEIEFEIDMEVEAL